MPCQSCAARRARMKAWIARRLGVTFDDANPPANIQAATAASEREAVSTAGTEPAGKPRAAHRKQGVARASAVEAPAEPAVRVLREGRVPAVRAKPRAARKGGGSRGRK